MRLRRIINKVSNLIRRCLSFALRKTAIYDVELLDILRIIFDIKE
jgi:hypothetical protein